ncbi:MAG: AI-2E family transporter [Deltaproteobacteria bacterium]|nr:AI-2E family transporter [Deltaproteobacteria bacterium]
MFFIMPSSLQKRAFIILLLFFLGLGLYVVYPFLMILILSCVVAAVFYPLHNKFLQWTRNRKNLSASISVVSFIFFLIIPVAIILSLVAAQLTSLIQTLTQSLSQNSAYELIEKFQNFSEPILVNIEKFLGFKIELSTITSRVLQWLAQFLATYSPEVFFKTTSFLFNFFIMLIVLFYLFRDGKDFLERLIRLSPIQDNYERHLIQETKKTIYGVIYGNFLTGLLQAILATIGFYIIGLEGALVWGFVTFFMSFIPLIGTSGVLVPVIISQLVQANYWQAAFITIYGAVIIGSIDNLLRPILIKTNIHQAWLFLSLFGGLAVFGAIGLILGPVIMAIITALIHIYETNFLEEEAS